MSASIIASVALVTAGRVWVDFIDDQRRAEFTWDIMEAQDLRLAIIEDRLAVELHSAGKHSEAEPRYRNALATFERLEEDDRVGVTLVGLGTLLLERETATEHDYESVESFLDRALAAFQRDSGPWIDQRGRALRGLRTLYGPDAWNLPDALKQIISELEALEREARGEEPVTDVPSPSTPAG